MMQSQPSQPPTRRLRGRIIGVVIGVGGMKAGSCLYSLVLSGTRVTDEGVSKLQEALPDCKTKTIH
jgi:hypothetical protein